MSDSELDSLFNDDWPEDHKSGVVVVAGRPNVGKSTLINRILGQKIAAVTPKPQTTRRNQLGILTDAASQILFVDTPGLHEPVHKLGEFMVRDAQRALRDADVVLLLFDVSQAPEAEDKQIAELVNRLKGQTPVVVALNKADALKPEQSAKHASAYTALIENESAHFISALKGAGVDELLADLVKRMPEGPRYYPGDQVSEVPMRTIAAEIIREKVMLNTEAEVPHAVAVEIEGYEERSDNMTYISAIVYVERESQKGIVVGKGGAMIKKIGSEARKELEPLTGTPIFLDLRVKVLPNWRSDEKFMNRLGFKQDKDKG
jgi:GTP-binding protein Era